MKTMSISVSLRSANDTWCLSLPLVAVHGPTRSRGYGNTVEAAVSDLFTTRLAAEAAVRCELPIEEPPT